MDLSKERERERERKRERERRANEFLLRCTWNNVRIDLHAVYQ